MGDGQTEGGAAADPKRQKQISNNGVRVETVFLTGLKSDIIKNGIVFKREF